MEIKRRIQLSKLIEKMNSNRNFSKKIGLKDTSVLKKGGKKNEVCSS